MGLKMKYFVLKPKAKHTLDVYAGASQDAMIAYSERIRGVDPIFADQLLFWATKEKETQDNMLD